MASPHGDALRARGRVGLTVTVPPTPTEQAMQVTQQMVRPGRRRRQGSPAPGKLSPRPFTSVSITRWITGKHNRSTVSC